MQIRIRERLELILKKVEAACERSGRSFSEVKIVAAVKSQPVEKVNQYIELCKEFGICCLLGENYLQDYQKHQPNLLAGYSAHYIGRVQSNKILSLVQNFDVIESLSSLEHAKLLNRQAQRLNKIMPCYLQVNISADVNKSGVLLEGLEEFCFEINNLESVRLQGFMTILADYKDLDRIRSDYARLNSCRNVIQEKLLNTKLLYNDRLGLSMGMSADFEIAVEEGADLIRLGTALFGERNLED